MVQGICLNLECKGLHVMCFKYEHYGHKKEVCMKFAIIEVDPIEHDVGSEIVINNINQQVTKVSKNRVNVASPSNEAVILISRINKVDLQECKLIDVLGDILKKKHESTFGGSIRKLWSRNSLCGSRSLDPNEPSVSFYKELFNEDGVYVTYCLQGPFLSLSSESKNDLAKNTLGKMGFKQYFIRINGKWWVKGINDTLILLIPKIDIVHSMKNFRPTSL
ncbi:hypothetical protein CR513_15642, partial [Mucuna pruriens]